MSVSIEPASQLGFNRPLTQLVKRTLTVANNNAQPVAFKVKTTAPKQYCVRPNSGRIEPGERVEVQVLLQPMKEDPEPGAKCRDKFLVQSAVITPEREARSLSELWSIVEKEDKASISEHKIRCTYLPPLETDAAAHLENGTSEKAVEVVGATEPGLGPTGFSSTLARDDDKEEKYNSVRSISVGAAPHMNGHSHERPISVLEPTHASTPEAPPSYSQAPDSKEKAISPVAPAAAVVTGGVAVALNNKPSTSSEKLFGQTNGSYSAASMPSMGATSSPAGDNAEVAFLRTQLNEARKEISRLQKQLKESEVGLRQRSIVTAPTRSQGESLRGPAQQLPSGEVAIPLQTVAMLVAGTFFVTWLFF